MKAHPRPIRQGARRRSATLAAAGLAALLALVGAPGPFAPHPVAALGNIILVTTTVDATFPANGLCSLRDAIAASNVGGLAGYCDPGSAGADSIRFSLGAGTPVIAIGSNLPTITQPVTIRGDTGGATRVRLLGPASGTGLTISGSSVSIRSLVIDSFATGISVGGTGATIVGSVIGPNTSAGIQGGGGATIGGTTGVTPGGPCTGDCNLIAGNGIAGLALSGGGTVIGNFIGTNGDGTAASANGAGISIGSGTWTIGGTTAGAGNLVSGNSNDGMEVHNCGCTIQGNRIGTNAAGTGKIANGGAGIMLSGTPGTIGGTAVAAGNVISGNAGNGIELIDGSGLTIVGNRIGVGATGTALGNGGDGIGATGGAPFSSNVVGSAVDPAAANTIAHNGGAGIRVVDVGIPGVDDHNRFRGNSIFANASFGIVLGSLTNAGIDPPTITSLGPVTGTACAMCSVDVYSDNGEEGQVFEGTVMSDPLGHWTFGDLFAGPNVTATATDIQNNTSEFSAPFAIPAPPFTDIGASGFKSEVAWLYANGITTGCTATTFCPTAPVTREQMASFLARELRLPSTATDYFTDDETSPHEGDINKIAAAGISTGCAQNRYCPTAIVLRDQMASFLSRAAGLTVGAGRNYFSDDDGNTHESNIDRAAAAGIASGCGSYQYCPGGSVTREQMAAFLRRLIAPVSPPPYPAP